MIRIIPVLHLLSVGIAFYSITFLLSALVGLVFEDIESFFVFTALFALTLLPAGMLYLMTKRFLPKLHLGNREAYLLTALHWIVLPLIGSAPFFVLGSHYGMTWSDSIFESVSGLTSTGGTALKDIEILPKAFLFYRQITQWLGGIGVVLLTVLILPILGSGATNLYASERSPLQVTKLLPRIRETAKMLWQIYSILTIFCIVAYFIAGMNLFEAITHSFSTVSLGGFSIYNDSMGHFQNESILFVSVLFMVISAISFHTHFSAFRYNSFSFYKSDTETRTLIKLFIAFSIIVILLLFVHEKGMILHHKILMGIFHTVSIMTTTGFTAMDYFSWHHSIPFFLTFISFIGGASGSTSGGIKVVRSLLVFRHIGATIKHLIHPHRPFHVRLGGQLVSSQTLQVIWSLFGIYILSFLVLTCVMTMTGLDIPTAFSAVAASINNTGQGMANISNGFSDLSHLQKIILSFTMLLGRLEIFSLLILVVPSFWRY